MSDDPQLRKQLAALIRRGASEADLEAFTQEYEHQHRFANPATPALTTEGERVLPGAPRKEGLDEKLAGIAGAGAQGLTFGLSDELGGLAGGAAALATGHNPVTGYETTRDAARQQTHAFQAEHPTLSGVAELAGGLALPVGGLAKGAVTAGRVAKTGAAAGAAYGFGKGEGSLEDQALSTATGAVTGAVLPTALYGGAKAVGAAVPKLARLLGVTTASGRNAAAEKAITTAIQRSGQTVDDVLARAEAIAAEGGTPTLAEAMGPGARTALDAMPALGDEAASLAAKTGSTLPKGEVAGAFQRAARRQPPTISMPTLGLKLSLPAKAVTAGLRRSGRKEAEAALMRMLSPADEFLGPMPASRIAGGIRPSPEVEREALQSMLLNESPEVMQNTANPSRLSPGFIARRNEKLGIRPRGAPSEADIRSAAEHLADPANQDANLETLLQLSVEKGAPKPPGGPPLPPTGPRAKLPPGTDVGPDDLTGLLQESLTEMQQAKAAGREPDWKFLKRTLGMSGKLGREGKLRDGRSGIPMLLGTGGAALGALTGGLLATKRSRLAK